MTNPIGLTGQQPRNRELPQVVWKYSIQVGDTKSIWWPPGSYVTLSRVAPFHSSTVEFWVAHTQPTGERDLDGLFGVDVTIYGTGQTIPGRSDVVSTCIDFEHPLVWHLVIDRGE